MSTHAAQTAGIRGRQATRNEEALLVAARRRFRATPLRLEEWRAWFNQQLSASSKNSEQARLWPPELSGSDVLQAAWTRMWGTPGPFLFQGRS